MVCPNIVQNMRKWNISKFVITTFLATKNFHSAQTGAMYLRLRAVTHPYRGPSLPIADTIITLFAVSSHTLSTNG